MIDSDTKRKLKRRLADPKSHQPIKVTPEIKAAGDRLLEKAEQDYKKREEDSARRIRDMAWDEAGTISAMAKGRVMFVQGASYNCFECLYHKKSFRFQDKLICVNCSNGSFFAPKNRKELALC